VTHMAGQLSEADLKQVGLNLTQRKDLLALNTQLLDNAKAINTLLGAPWKFVLNLPSLKNVPDDKWNEASVGLKLFVEGITKDLHSLDPDSLAALKSELSQEKIIELVYDEKKTTAISPQGCVGVHYDHGIIYVYWRILPKMMYPHFNKSIGDYVVDNCSGPDELSAKNMKKRVLVNDSTLYFEGVGDMPPAVVAHWFIGITAYKDLPDWRNKQKVGPTYVCLRVTEIITIIPINEGKNRCSEIATKRGAKYYIPYHPAQILEAISAAEKGVPVEQKK